MTERLHFHFSLSCTGEGNGNPPQCSCLENPRDGGAWWAAVCGVAESRTRLKRLSSSSSSSVSITWAHFLFCVSRDLQTSRGVTILAEGKDLIIRREKSCHHIRGQEGIWVEPTWGSLGVSFPTHDYKWTTQ